jgi:hypothetical protein
LAVLVGLSGCNDDRVTSKVMTDSIQLLIHLFFVGPRYARPVWGDRPSEVAYTLVFQTKRLHGVDLVRLHGNCLSCRGLGRGSETSSSIKCCPTCEHTHATASGRKSFLSRHSRRSMSPVLPTTPVRSIGNLYTRLLADKPLLSLFDTLSIIAGTSGLSISGEEAGEHSLLNSFPLGTLRT